MLSHTIQRRLDDQVWRYPPGRLTQLMTGALLLFTLWAYSAPAGGYTRWTSLAGTLWLLLGSFYVLRVAIAAIARWSIHFVNKGSWLIVPALGALALAFVKTSAPFEARYWISRDAMDAAAQQVIARPREAAQINRIGLWPTSRVEVFRGGMRFLIDASGSGDRFGFAYSPSRRPPEIGRQDTYRHLDGPWYVWVAGRTPERPRARRRAQPAHAPKQRTAVQPNIARASSRHASHGRQASDSAVRARAVAAAKRALRHRRVGLLAPAIGARLGAIVAVVGRPDSRRGTGTYCHARWTHVGLTVVLVSRSSLDSCGRGRVVGAFVTGRRWSTSAGLEVGSSFRELRRLYPTTKSDGYRWWLLPSIGTGGSSVPLHAHVSRGHVDLLLLN